MAENGNDQKKWHPPILTGKYLADLVGKDRHSAQVALEDLTRIKNTGLRQTYAIAIESHRKVSDNYYQREILSGSLPSERLMDAIVDAEFMRDVKEFIALAKRILNGDDEN